MKVVRCAGDEAGERTQLDIIYENGASGPSPSARKQGDKIYSTTLDLHPAHPVLPPPNPISPHPSQHQPLPPSHALHCPRPPLPNPRVMPGTGRETDWSEEARIRCSVTANPLTGETMTISASTAIWNYRTNQEKRQRSSRGLYGDSTERERERERERESDLVG